MLYVPLLCTIYALFMRSYTFRRDIILITFIDKTMSLDVTKEISQNNENYDKLEWPHISAMTPESTRNPTICFTASSDKQNGASTCRITRHLRWVISSNWLKLTKGNKSGNSSYAMFYSLIHTHPDSKVHGDYIGPTWVLSAPDGPHIGTWTLLSGHLLFVLHGKESRRLKGVYLCRYT